MKVKSEGNEQYYGVMRSLNAQGNASATLCSPYDAVTRTATGWFCI